MNLTVFYSIQIEAERILAQFRARFGFPFGPPVPIEIIAQAMGLQCRVRNSDELCGYTGGLSIENQAIYTSDDCAWNRRTFTVAHEVGHWMLHEGHMSPLCAGSDKAIPLSCLLGSNQGWAARKGVDDRVREAEADKLGATLLMPCSFLFPEAAKYKTINAQSIRELAKTFHVSTKAMLRRVNDLHRHLAWSGPAIDWLSLYHLEDSIRGRKPNGEDRSTEELAEKCIKYLRRQLTHRASGEHSRPFVIELAGTPNAGKDTLIEIIRNYLQDAYGFKVRVVDEGVNSCHIDKSLGVDRLYKTVALAVMQLYEACYENPGGYDCVIFNRGIFDRLAFLRTSQMLGQINTEQEQIHAKYLLSYAHLEDIVFMLLISPEESVRRESERQYTLQLAKLEGQPLAEPRVVNERLLSTLNDAYMSVYRKHKEQFSEVYSLDFADGEHAGIMETVLGLIQVIHPKNLTQLPIPGLLYTRCLQNGFDHPRVSSKARRMPRRSEFAQERSPNLTQQPLFAYL